MSDIDAQHSMTAQETAEAFMANTRPDSERCIRRDDRFQSDHPAVPVAEVAREQSSGWVSVEEQLPDSGRAVLACYLNRVGKQRIIRAHWVTSKSIIADTESDIGVYDESDDEYYDPEGWYENIDNWDDYSSVSVCEGNVTHWMPLPPPPGQQGRMPAAEASGSDDARLTAAYAESRKDEAEQRDIDAQRYRWLRSRPLDSVQRGGVFAGMTPSNVVLNGEDLDAAIDAASLAEATERGKQIAAGLKLE